MIDGQSDGHKKEDEKMVTGFDMIHHNRPLQKHWIKRVVAYLADFFISSILVFIPLYLLNLTFFPDIIILFQVMAGAFQVFYSSVLEYYNRQTLGKNFFNLEVEGLRGGIDLHEALIRNISKVHGLLIFLDTIVGLATEGDPRQRYLDSVADTTVKGSSDPHHYRQFITEHMRKEETPSSTHFMERGITDVRRCRECGGELEVIEFGRSKCTRCGRIQ
ncbi:MAG: RDD family protein [Thermoplasmata archaeon]